MRVWNTSKSNIVASRGPCGGRAGVLRHFCRGDEPVRTVGPGARTAGGSPPSGRGKPLAGGSSPRGRVSRPDQGASETVRGLLVSYLNRDDNRKPEGEARRRPAPRAVACCSDVSGVKPRTDPQLKMMAR